MIFMKLLAQVGFLYLSAVPIAIFCAFMCAPYNRQFVFTFLSQVIHLFATAVLYLQFAWKKSGYKIGNLDAGGILPSSFSKNKYSGTTIRQW